MILLFSVFCQPFPAKSQATKKLARMTFGSQPTAKTVDWPDFWATFNKVADWNLQYHDGVEWSSKKHLLQVIRTYPQANTMKFTLNFTSEQSGPYRLYLSVDKAVKQYFARVAQYCYSLEYGEYQMLFNWTDMMSIPNLQTQHGVQNDRFYFAIQHDNVPTNYTLLIDPTFKAVPQTSAEDAYVDEDNPNSNYGSADQLTVKAGTGVLNKRTFVQFNVARVTASCTLINATLRLYCYQVGGGQTYQVFKTDESFAESSVTWNNQPDTTGNYVNKSRPSSAGWWEVNVTSLFDATEAYLGFGIKDYREGSPDGGSYFRSKEYSDYHPELEVCFEYEYMYTFDGEYSETGSYIDDICLDVHYQNYSQTHFIVEGSTEVYFGEQPLFFSWPVDQYIRVFYPPSNDTITVFTPPSPYYVYMFEIKDFAGVLVDESCLETYRIINNTNYLVERRNVKDNVGNIVPMIMEQGASYLLILNNSDSQYRFGYFLAASILDRELVLPAIAFSLKTQQTYKHVFVEAVRTDGETITVNYEDLLEQTNQVGLEITYRNGTLAYTDSATFQKGQFQWTQADNQTDYMTTTTVDHETYGTLIYRYEVLHSPEADPPWDFSVFGTWGPLDPEAIFPLFIILITAAVFSQAYIPIGIVAVLVVSGYMWHQGWLALDATLLGDAVAFGIILIIAAAKLRRK